MWWQCSALGPVACCDDLLGYFRDFPLVAGKPTGVARHSPELIRWLREKIETSENPKLRQAGIDGLNRQLEAMLPVITKYKDEIPAGLPGDRENAIAYLQDKHPRGHVLLRQRLIRLAYALGNLPANF